MIKVSVMYPHQSNARFDHTYYRDRHMPMVQARLGSACRFYTVDKGLSGEGPADAPPYVAMCHLYCDSVEAFQTAFAPHAEEILADIPRYTDLTPVLQFSEVIVGQP